MRKLPNHTLLFLRRQQIRLRRKAIRAANRRSHHQLVRRTFKKKHSEYFLLRERREQFRRRLYHRSYRQPPVTIAISGDFGIEDATTIPSFLEKANEIIDFNNTTLAINLEECTRVWPSAITLLCSLMQWVELSAKKDHRPRIASSAANSDKVNSYLNHCGFYGFVSRPPDAAKTDHYTDTDIVKIERETKASNIESREDQIKRLLKQYSTLNANQIELFDCKVLTETFNNVTEHGVSHRDRGWWVLAQYHLNYARDDGLEGTLI